MKRLVLALVFVLLSSLPAAAQQIRPLKVGGKLNCTSFSIYPYHWLTAAHCVIGEVTVGDEAAQVVKIDKGLDLALLKTEEDAAVGYKVAKDTPKRFDRVRLTGHILGLQETLSTEHIISNPSIMFMGWRPRPVTAIYPNASNGGSGAPVTNERNELVGVYLGGGNPGYMAQLFGGITPLSDLKRFLGMR